MHLKTILWLLVGKASLLIVIGVALFAYGSFASYRHYADAEGLPPAPPPTVYQVVAATPPTLPARAYLVFDVESGEVLAAHNSEAVLPLASVTKLATAAAVLDTFPLLSTTTVVWSDVATEGRAGKLEAYEQYTYRDLLFPLLLESSNDAAAVYERVESETLLETMNALATEAGASSVYFDDGSGLSSENVASADDLARLVRSLYRTHAHVFDITRLSMFVGEETGWVNNSPFIDEEGYVGGKHGYTEAAGRTVAALFKESFAGGGRVVGYIVLGSDNLRQDVSALRTFVQSSVRYE